MQFAAVATLTLLGGAMSLAALAWVALGEAWRQVLERRLARAIEEHDLVTSQEVVLPPAEGETPEALVFRQHAVIQRATAPYRARVERLQARIGTAPESDRLAGHLLAQLRGPAILGALGVTISTVASFWSLFLT